MELEKYLQWLKLNKNSKKTIKTYFQQVNCFGNWCNYNFNQETFDDYCIRLKDNNSYATFNLFITAIKSYIEYNKCEWELPKYKTVKKRPIKFYFTEETMKDVYKHLPLITEKYQEKELVLMFMFYTGVRVQQVIDLKKSDINFNKKEIVIYGAKGNKDRMIPFLNNEMLKRLKIHCEKVVGDKVFNITYNQIQYLLKKIQESLNIDESEIVSSRTMRISFAKYCLSIGMDILYLKKLMGHTEIQVTELYAEPDEKMIKEFCEKIRNGE